MSGHTGARLLIEKLPASSTLIGDIDSCCQFCIDLGWRCPHNRVCNSGRPSTAAICTAAFLPWHYPPSVNLRHPANPDIHAEGEC